MEPNAFADRHDMLLTKITDITTNALGGSIRSSQITALASAVAHVVIEREDALRAQVAELVDAAIAKHSRDRHA